MPFILAIQISCRVYHYHLDWRTVRNQTKFDRLVPLSYARPLIREVTDGRLRQHGLSREKLLAIVVRLLNAIVKRSSHLGASACTAQSLNKLEETTSKNPGPSQHSRGYQRGGPTPGLRHWLVIAVAPCARRHVDTVP